MAILGKDAQASGRGDRDGRLIPPHLSTRVDLRSEVGSGTRSVPRTGSFPKTDRVLGWLAYRASLVGQRAAIDAEIAALDAGVFPGSAGDGVSAGGAGPDAATDTGSVHDHRNRDCGMGLELGPTTPEGEPAIPLVTLGPGGDFRRVIGGRIDVRA